MATQLSRQQVAEQLGEFYSRRLTNQTGKPANVWSYFDEQKRAYVIRGENLPAHPDIEAQYPNGWSLLDYLTPREARQVINTVVYQKEATQ